MKKKSLLLPYWCQKTSWWIFLSWLIWIAIVVISDTMHLYLLSPLFPKWILALYSFLPSIATLMICLSEENPEDEYIGHIRARSVILLVIIVFVSLMINASLTNVGLRLWGWSPENGYLMLSWLYTNPFIITMLYLVIFKGSLFINWLKTRNDGQ